MRELAARFVAVGDDAAELFHGQGPESDFFRKVREQSHHGPNGLPQYAGKDGYQGIYALAPGGVLLGSIQAADNPGDNEILAEMLEMALEKWEAMPREQRLPAGGVHDGGGDAPAGEAHRTPLRAAQELYPADGLVLRVVSRDLPREEEPHDHAMFKEYQAFWNLDYAWFTKQEARSIVPEVAAVGAKHAVPEHLVRRLAALHLVDSVRNGGEAFRDAEVTKATLTAEVVQAEGDLISLRLEGETAALARGTWSLDETGAYGEPVPAAEQEHRYEARLLGRATFDRGAGRFRSFELVAVGTRRGARPGAGRRYDPGPAPLGFALTLAGDSASERIAPNWIGRYGWELPPE